MYPEELNERSINLAEDFQRRKAYGVMGGTYRPIQSNLPIAQYQAFVNDEVKAQEENSAIGNFGTALKNGAKSGVRGLIGVTKAAVDYNIAEHQKRDPNYRPVNDWAFGVSETLQGGIDALQREEIKADTAAGQLAYDLTEGAVQFAIQMAVTAATGGTAGGVYMGATIAGDQYIELRKEGVDVQRAAQAGLMNAPFQAMLEKIGMGKIMSKLPVGSGLKKKFGDILKAGLEEGITEGLQELPEQFTNIWAKDKNATPESMTKKWGENWEQNVKEAGYSALLGGILGGSARGLRIVTDNVTRKFGEKINEAQQQEIVRAAERVQQSGVDPQYAAAYIDANSQGETINVEAEAVRGFMQQSDGARIAESLGTTQEAINEAAELGQDIEVSRGDYITAINEHKGLFEATQDGMYFGVDGELTARANEKLKTLKEDKILTKEQSTALDAEVKAIVDSAIQAGMNKTHAENLSMIIESRAIIADPENPAAWLQKNKLRFEDGGKAKKNNGWFQKNFSAKERLQNDERAFSNKIDAFLNKKIKQNTIRVMRTPIALELVGAQNLPIDMSVANLNKVLLKKHGSDISPELLKKVPRALADPLMVFDTYSGEENKRRIVVALDLKTKNGATTVVPFELNVDNKGGRYVMNEMISTYAKTDKYTGEPKNEWFAEQIKNGKLLYVNRKRATTVLGNEKLYSLMPYQNSNSSKYSIANEEDLRKYRATHQGYYQTDKGMISPMDDGTYVITLFKGADASTVIHETGHYFVDTMINEAIADPSNTKLNNDAQILLEYGGMTIEQWKNASLDEKRAAHEKLAEGFETYIMEGKAPSAGLRSAFRRFAKWLTAIYSKIVRNDNAAELTDDVRGVFDRMLASREEIEMQAEMSGLFGSLPTELTNKLSPEAQESLMNKIDKVKDKAVDILVRKAMQEFNARRKADKAAFIAENRAKIEELVHREKVNQGRDLVGYYFGGEQKKNSPYFREVNGRMHANRQISVLRDANPSIIARKYRHAIGSVLPNYNDVLQDTKAAIDDRLNPIIEDLEAGIEEYNESTRDAWAMSGSEKGYWTNEEGQSVDPTIIQDYVKANGGKFNADVQAKLERDGYVFHSVADELQGTNWYANYVQENGHKNPSRKELERIAKDIYSGKDQYYYYQGLDLNNPEIRSEVQAAKAELDELYRVKEKLEKTPEGIDLVKMSKRSALSNEQRATFDEIAEQIGYSSGDEMAQAILNEPSERQKVRQLLNEAVQKRFPDIYKERELFAQQAREALYNDGSGELIALEHQLIEEELYKTIGREMGKQERARETKALRLLAEVKAKKIIQAMSVGDIIKGNGRRFMLAERRAAANAKKALKKGEFDLALEYKRQQLVNHELYRQALAIKGKTKSAQRFIIKMAKMKKENFGTEQHFDQIGALLARMNIKRRGYDVKPQAQSLLEYVADMREKYGDIIDLPEFVLNPMSDLSDPQGMSFAHYEDVVNALRNIYAVAKHETKMKKINDGISFENTKAEIMEALKKHEIDFIPQAGTPQYSRWQKFKNWTRAHWQANRSADNFYLSLDNWTKGWFTNHIYEPLTRCANDEAQMSMDLQRELEAAYKKWAPTKEARNAAGTKVYYEEIGSSLTKDELIQMVCNMGNDGNWHRLCETVPEGFTKTDMWVQESSLISREDAAEATRQNVVRFLGKYLTEADIEYAQAKINAYNKLWPRLRQVNLDTKGFAPKAVEATPTSFALADGKRVSMAGGYFPLVRDTQLGSAPNGQNRVASTDETFTSGMNTMTTASSSSKARTGGKYPVSLVAGCETSAVYDTIHDIAFRETILDLRRILNDEEIFREMKIRLGESNLKLLKENIEICANPRAYNGKVVQAEKQGDIVLNWLRTMTVNASILGNVKTSFQNLGNIFLYARSVESFGYADTLVALRNAIPNHTEIDRLCQKSVFMQDRMIVPEYSLREINGRGDLNYMQKQTLKWGAWMLSATDMATAKPVWAQAYSNKLNEGKTEQEAIEFADTVIRRTLGSSRIYEVASIRRGSDKFKLLTMFQGFFNTQFNQWDREEHLVAKLWKQGDKKDALLRLSAFLAGKWLAACLANIFLAFENPFEKDKDGYTKLTKELVNYPMSMLGPVGQATNVGIQIALGMRNYGYRFTPVQSTIDNTYTIASLAYRISTGNDNEGDEAEFGQRLFRLGANAYGISSSPINIMYNLYDIGTDKMDFELQDLIKRRPKSERKKERELLLQRETSED